MMFVLQLQGLPEIFGGLTQNYPLAGVHVLIDFLFVAG
jgi:hypothetical protein